MENKKQLYESIMKSVAKEVKKALNEKSFNNIMNDISNKRKLVYNRVKPLVIKEVLGEDIEELDEPILEYIPDEGLYKFIDEDLTPRAFLYSIFIKDPIAISDSIAESEVLQYVYHEVIEPYIDIDYYDLEDSYLYAISK